MKGCVCHTHTHTHTHCACCSMYIAVYAVGTLYCRVSPPFLSSSLLFTTCYMGTSNSSVETRERARRLAEQIGRWALMCLQTASPTCCTTFDTPAHFTKCSQWQKTQLYVHTCTYTCVHHSHNYGYVAPDSGGEPAGGNKTGGLVGSGDTSLVSIPAWPPQCSGVLIYGLARPIR